ncbi:MAG TPA: hypothetical protein VFV68_12230 [Agriterribacter sp.]|nr:hypothetical protein [Agriterribacter sp.]
MQKLNGDANCVEFFKPFFPRALYSASVNVVGKHLGGLLIIKAMPDSSIRMVFTNEVGFSFFDFGFKGDEFTVYHIIDQMDKKAVIKTLRKDFELILMQHIYAGSSYTLKNGSEYYRVFPHDGDYYYYVTDSACTKLIRMERGSRKKKVMEAITGDYTMGIPDTIGIKHNNFDFTIELKRIQDHAEQ